MNVELIPKIADQLIKNCHARHRVIVGGRGKGASWTIARWLLVEGLTNPHFIACVRQYQNSITHSVKKLLEDQIDLLGLGNHYKSYRTEIVGMNGTEFVFFGLQEHNSDKIRSLEGADRCWVEEAQSISRGSVDILRPTIRKEAAVTWWNLNPTHMTDPVYADYVAPEKPPKDVKVCWVSIDDNPWANDTLRAQCAADYERDPVAADHIWGGKLRGNLVQFVFNPKIIEVAMNRQNPVRGTGPVIVGADIAHRGGDEIVFYAINKDGVLNQRYTTNESAVQTREALDRFCTANGVSRVVIDNGHIGAAIADEFQELRPDIFVQREDFGGKPIDRQYANRVTELYFGAREYLDYISIPKDSKLRDQLICRRWSYIPSSEGERLKIEKKDEIQATPGWKSPDRADALVLAISGITESGIGLGQALGFSIY